MYVLYWRGMMNIKAGQAVRVDSTLSRSTRDRSRTRRRALLLSTPQERASLEINTFLCENTESWSEIGLLYAEVELYLPSSPLPSFFFLHLLLLLRFFLLLVPLLFFFFFFFSRRFSATLHVPLRNHEYH